MSEVDNTARLKHELRVTRYLYDATAAILALTSIAHFATGNIVLGALSLNLGLLYVARASSKERQSRSK